MIELCLFEPNIAGNVGSVIRTCAFFSSPNLHIIMPTGFIWNDKAMERAKMDYGDHINIIKYNNFEHFIEKNNNRRLILTTTRSTIPYYDIQYTNTDILIIGNETRGVTEQIRLMSQHQVKIPGKGRSLNMAISASIVLSEGIKQINTKRT